MSDNPLAPLPSADGPAVNPLDDDLGLDLQGDPDADRPRLPPVPMWRRYVSLTVDTAVFAVLLLSVEPAVYRSLPMAAPRAGRVALLVAFALPVVLQATVYALRPGQTLGRVLAGVRVVGADGRPASLARGFLAREPARWALTQLGVILLPLLRDQDGRFPHETLTRTWVVPAGRAPEAPRAEG